LRQEIVSLNKKLEKKKLKESEHKSDLKKLTSLEKKLSTAQEQLVKKEAELVSLKEELEKKDVTAKE
jgi:predicted  nucleic acid-binding Zn-ribbon protein